MRLVAHRCIEARGLLVLVARASRFARRGRTADSSERPKCKEQDQERASKKLSGLSVEVRSSEQARLHGPAH